MSHLIPATSVPQSGSGFKAESPASCPSGSCFCPAAVAILAQAGLLEAPVLAGYFQGPQAPCPTGISSCRCSASGVHGSGPVGTVFPVFLALSTVNRMALAQ